MKAVLMPSLNEGSIKKVSYQLSVGDNLLPLNELIGRRLTLRYHGTIICCHCGRITKKSFSQGYCYPCFRKLPQCDSCIMSPEKCHYHRGTCRDSEWGERFCMTDHIVYLANSSGVKVGITRVNQIPTRWIDQGAVQALEFIRVSSRRLSGFLEVLFKEIISDRTNWRAMLKGAAKSVDLYGVARELVSKNLGRIAELQNDFGSQSIHFMVGGSSDLANHKCEKEDKQSKVLSLSYPVATYPVKVISQSFDNKMVIEGTLQGVKGQYLILDTGVMNVRKHTSYEVSVSVD